MLESHGQRGADDDEQRLSRHPLHRLHLRVECKRFQASGVRHTAPPLALLPAAARSDDVPFVRGQVNGYRADVNRVGSN
jgi:hypothetical protein